MKSVTKESTMTEPPSDAEARRQSLRRAYSMHPSGVVGVCGMGSDGPVGMAASTFTSVSLEPPLVSICIDRASSTWPRLASLPRLGLSVLGADHAVTARTLAAKSGDRFAGSRWEVDPDGAMFLHGSPLWLTCEVASSITAGDHEIIVLRVLDSRLFDSEGPLIFHQSQLRPL